MQLRPLKVLFAVTFTLAAAACCNPGDGDRPPAKIAVTTSSDAARAAYLEGRDLFEALRLTDAHERFTGAVELDPDLALAWLGVAMTSPAAPDVLAAIRRAEAAAGGASDGERMLIAAFAAAVEGDTARQRAELERLAAAYPDDERAQHELGALLLNLQEPERAVDRFRAALAINPGFAPACNSLGYALRFCDDLEGAREAFERYIELVPDQPNPYDSYGELLMKMGRFEASIDSYRKAIEIEPTFVPSYVGIANNLIFLARTDEAREVLRGLESVARNPAERRLASAWTIAAYLHEEDFDRALEELTKRIGEVETGDDPIAAAQDQHLAGDILLAAGRDEEAEAAYGRALTLVEASELSEEVKQGARRNLTADLARIALDRGRIGRAERLVADHAAAVARHGDRFEKQRAHELAGRLALARGEPKDALFELAGANQQDPRVLLLNARAFAAAGDRSAARAACEQVIHFNQLSLPLALVRQPARELLGIL